jgi:hypothetical protein
MRSTATSSHCGTCRLNDNDGKQQWEDPTYIITDGALAG